MPANEKGLPIKETAIVVLSVAMVLFQLYTAATFPLASFMQTAVHLGFALTIIFLANPLKWAGPWRIPGLIVTALLILGGLAFNLNVLWVQGDFPPMESYKMSPHNFFLAIVAIICVLEGARRVTGLIMVVVVLVFLAYCALGPYLPGMFGHPGIKLGRVLSTSYITIQGMYGIPLQMSSQEIFSLLAYGGFLFSFGGGDFIMDFSKIVVGRLVGGIAKIAVIASALFGTISGSGPANTASTGAFTIPTMIRSGYSPTFAAAVEASASVGGQLMPPVMGAASFLIAQNLNMPYGDLIIAAAIPSFLFYAAVFLAVDCESRLLNLKPLDQKDVPPVNSLFKGRWHVIASLAILIYLLVIEKYGVAYSGFWAIVALFATYLVQELIQYKRIRMGVLWEAFKDGSIQSAKSGSLIAATSAAAGIILGSIDLTGLAIKLTASLTSLAGGSTFLLLVFSMIASLILGMGLPTVACYILVAALAVPAMVQGGIPPLAAHLFAFYFAIMSNLTPPVALTAYVAAGIAKADPIRTSIVGSRLGIMGFAIPFVFVYRPGMLFIGSPIDTIYSIGVAVLAASTLVFGLMGYFRRKLAPLERLLLTFGGACLLWPTVSADIIGACSLGVFTFMYIARNLAGKRGLAGAPEHNG
ncbi:TRAP transporter fused permease subunit [Desulfovibrio sp. OttesenSCG-928-O18]|nr:TRAP transporter fused permease subunit [Desulfovibrio sp. OttesenSCG-928-O18]